VLDSAINYRLGDVIAIKYHGGHPDENDPFYLENTEVQDKKSEYYNVTGVPTTFVNGVELGERTFSYLNKAIDYCLSNQASDYLLSVKKHVDNQQLIVSAELTSSKNEETRDLRLFVAAIEEHIDMNCRNGETELNYTMRSLLTGANGMPLNQLNVKADNSFSYEETCSISHFYQETQLGVVAFLQDYDSHKILATAYIGPQAEGSNRLALMNLINTPDQICMPNYYGQVIFRNDGANVLTSATLNVKVNETIMQYPWSGQLNYLERDTLSFDGHNLFQLNSTTKNEVEVWFSDINGSNSVSNVQTTTFSHSVQATYGVQLKLYTDKKPEETTWKLYDSAGNVVREGGPYDGLARKFITTNFELTSDDCYHLAFTDAGGNGIKGANGNGYYQLFQIDEAGKTQRILQGDYDGAVCDVFFRLSGAPTPTQKRLVVFEEFTNTSCDPCAEFSPALDKTIYERMNDMVAITYHYNFPSPLDPFYLANPNEAMARANYYDVTGVPALRVDGEHVGAWGYESYLDGYVTGAGAIPATVQLDAEAQLNEDLLTVDVSLTPIGITDGSNLRLHVVAVEERVEWAETAANEERSWNYVMRKMLTDTAGQALEANLTQVTPYQYKYSWQVENYYDKNELGIVAFVQNDSTKQILGAIYTPRPTGNPNAAKLIQILNTPKRICTPSFSSDIVVRNIGRETLTSAMLNVCINGKTQSTPWTGRLDYLAIDTLHTPLFTDFPLNEATVNDADIWLSALNGSNEESLHHTFTIANAHKAQHAVRLTIMTDNSPEEITWKLYNSAGDIVCEGGPYSESRKRQVTDLALDTDDCYMIAFADAGGNGIAEGRGYYMLHEVDADGKTRLLVQADYSGATHEVSFSLENVSSDASISTISAHDETTGNDFDLSGRHATKRSHLIINKEGNIKINK